MSQEKIFHLKAMGAEVQLTRSDVSKGHPEYYRDVAERLAREIPNSFFVNQFGNPANPKAHEETTAPEIWSQMDRRLAAVVCGVGTGGTLTGLSRFFARTAPGVEIVLADPAGSILAHYAKSHEVVAAKGGWLVEGIGGDSIPPVAEFSRVHSTYTIPDAEAFRTRRGLLGKERIISRTSPRTPPRGAVRLCRAPKTPKRLVRFVCAR